MFNMGILVKIFRSRIFIHICGAVFVGELVLSILTHMYSYIENGIIFYSALSAPLIGIISEIWDYYHETYYPNRWLKHGGDVISWAFGGCIFIAIELFKRS